MWQLNRCDVKRRLAFEPIHARWRLNIRPSVSGVSPVSIYYPGLVYNILRFELSLLLHLTPTLSAPLTFCKFAQKWGRFHLKQCYTKMTASTRRSFWYLMILTWNAVHNPLESIEGKVLQFYDFHKFSSVFSCALSYLSHIKKLVVVLKPNSKVAKLRSRHFGTFWRIVSFFVQKLLLRP